MLLSIEQFADKYDTLVTTIDSTICQKPNGILKKSIIVSDRGIRYIDESVIERRLNFVKIVWNRSHEYYYMLSEYVTDYKLSKVLQAEYGGSRASWNMFLRQDLFSLSAGNKSATNPIVNKKLWKFFRFARRVIREIDRLFDKRIAEIYARLPNRDKYEEIYKERIPPEGRR